MEATAQTSQELPLGKETLHTESGKETGNIRKMFSLNLFQPFLWKQCSDSCSSKSSDNSVSSNSSAKHKSDNDSS